MKYIDQENPRFIYYISETLNGFGIQVLNVERDERYPFTPTIAYKNGLTLPEDFVCNCSANEKAELEAQLKRLASINDLIEIE
jgi:hypothetical protein